MNNKNLQSLRISDFYLNNPFIAFHHTINYACDTTLTYSNETHPGYEIMYLVSGTVNYIIEGKSYIINSGDIIILNSSELHKLNIDLKVQYERYVIQFSNDIFPSNTELNTLIIHSIIDNVQNSNRIIPKDIVNKLKINEIFLEFDNHAKNTNTFTPALFTSSIIKFFVLLNEALIQTTSMSNIKIDNKLIKNVTDYITKNISKKFTVIDVANHVHFSESRLSHVFKSTMGITLNKYIILKRIQHAQNLIKHGASLKDAAIESGYQYYSSFYNNYKLIFGEPPKNENKRKW